LPPLVVDLSSLWAGPLCSHLLQLAGARVIKVESLSRPDGARNGPADFFDLMNAGKASVALDLQSPHGRAQLQALLSKADIVIEASRPRALRQLGIHAEELLQRNPHLSWIAISGYGRGEPMENWIAYGDDAGVAAGLSQLMYETIGEHLIVGDAIADPLTGLHAALAAWASHLSGGGRLISLSLCEVVRHCIAFDTPVKAGERKDRHIEWRKQLALESIPVETPVARMPADHARALGADTGAVLSELGIVC
jgi:crotonobetainyl-CoA:carnitine CoA-transferase CaiB-like acyl-CoA transferase